MKSWKVQEAKARFGEFLSATLTSGPQIVTRRGVAVAVLVPIEQGRQLQEASRPGLKQLLLAPAPRYESLAPVRRDIRRRPPIRFQ